MTAVPKRRWYQFSLRTLLVAMTLAGGLAGVAGRVCQLRQLSVFHDSEKIRCRKEAASAMDAAHEIRSRDRKRAMDEYLKSRRQVVEAIHDKFLLALSSGPPEMPEPSDEYRAAIRKHDALLAQSFHHWYLSRLYRRATYRPWTIVDETPLQPEIRESSP